MTLPYLPKNRINIIVGNFGSGKTEVSVNLALMLSGEHRVRIVDLDVVNPYFRCREAREEMERAGIDVIYPKGEFHAADLPIVLPEVKGAIDGNEGYVIFDVGGDDLGARVLGSLADVISNRSYSMFQVINTRRPFTRTVNGCLKMKEEIESASRLRITGLVANTHLIDQTDLDVVKEGLDTAREVADQAGLTLEFVAINRELLPEFGDGSAGYPVLSVERMMLPPWKLKSMTDRAARVLKDGSSTPDS